MPLSSEVLDSVGNEIAMQLSELSPTLGAIDREIGETFPIWLIDTETLTPGATTVGQAAKNISRATSVIYSGGVPAFAVESHLGGGGAKLTSLPPEDKADQAIKFRAVFDVIDQEFGTGDGVVRQLEAPAFRFVALWLVLADAEWVYPVEPGTTGLKSGSKNDWATVRDSLLHTDPIRGLSA